MVYPGLVGLYARLFFGMGMGGISLLGLDTTRGVDTLDTWRFEPISGYAELELGYRSLFVGIGGQAGDETYALSDTGEFTPIGTGSVQAVHGDIGARMAFPGPVPGEIAGFLRTGYLSASKDFSWDSLSQRGEWSGSYAMICVRLQTLFGGVSYGYPVSGSKTSALEAYLAVPLSHKESSDTSSARRAVAGAYYRYTGNPEAGAQSLGCLLGGFVFQK